MKYHFTNLQIQNYIFVFVNSQMIGLNFNCRCCCAEAEASWMCANMLAACGLMYTTCVFVGTTCESEAVVMLLMCVAGGREITNMFLNLWKWQIAQRHMIDLEQHCCVEPRAMLQVSCTHSDWRLRNGVATVMCQLTANDFVKRQLPEIKPKHPWYKHCHFAHLGLDSESRLVHGAVVVRSCC